MGIRYNKIMDKDFFKNSYKVYIWDRAGRSSEHRYYKTRAGADKRFDQLLLTVRPNGHNAVLMVEIATDVIVRGS